jgi:hypothetical protein
MEEREVNVNINHYDIFSTRSGCNTVKRYFDAVLDIIYDFEGYENLANILHRYVADNLIQKKQISSIISLILTDKYKYRVSSYNIENDISHFDPMIREFRKWKAVDIMFVYYHPELGIYPMNPKNKVHWSKIKLLRKSELIILYAGLFQDTMEDDETFDVAIEKALLLLKGQRVKTPALLSSIDYEDEEEEDDDEEESSAVFFAEEESPFYGIQVTNNQFHNGNVEAWKKIIRSYTYTFQDVKVIIYYDKEEVRDIDSLFQWGKIKPGTVINIKVIGKDLRNKRMSALVYHLKEGASPYFERYIKGNPRMVLKLFGNE